MQFKQLEVFAAVARLRSFSRAAEVLYLTQPTVSAHMAALERDLGCRLVVRSARRVELTEQGEVLRRYADEILGLCRRAEQDVRTAGGEIQGALTIAASTVPSQYLIPRVLPHLRRQYPKLRFQVYQGDSGQVAQRIFDNSAEIGIAGGAVRRTGCVCMPFLSERLVIVAPNTPEYSCYGDTISPEDLGRLPILARETGSGTWRQAEEYFKAVSLDLRRLEVAAQLQSTESILQGVCNGLGVSVVSQIAAEDFARRGEIRIFRNTHPALRRQFYLLYHRSRALSPAASMLLRELPAFWNLDQPGNL